MSEKIFTSAVKVFDPDNLLEAMLDATEGTVFLVGEQRIRNPEGDGTVEMTFAQIYKAKDERNI